MTAFTRPVAPVQSAQTGRSRRARISRVSVGYDASNPSGCELVEQRDPPQMRILDQPRGHVVHERRERVLAARLRTPGSRSPFR